MLFNVFFMFKQTLSRRALCRVLAQLLEERRKLCLRELELPKKDPQFPAGESAIVITIHLPEIRAQPFQLPSHCLPLKQHL